MEGTKSNGNTTNAIGVDSLGPPHQTTQNTNGSGQRVGSINSNPGSQASRGSKYNIHQQNAMQNLQNS